MNAYLEEFFKTTPLSINSVLQAAVGLAERVNSRTDLSGKDKTELVVSTLTTFFGESQPEMLALVTGVIPGMLEIVVSAARGKLALQQVKDVLVQAKGRCVPALEAKAKDKAWSWVGLCYKGASASAPVAASAPAAPAAAEPAGETPAEKVTVREASA